MKSSNLLSLANVAKEAAKNAGKKLLEEFQKPQEVLLSKGRDIKLAVDEIAEKIIIDCLKEDSKLPILSEEAGITDDLGSEFWVVDPLDGTSNFFRSIPICSSSISLIKDGSPCIGVIYDFLNDNLYWGANGMGAHCNEMPIQVSNVSSKSEGTLMTGIPAKDNYSNSEFEKMIDYFQSWKKVRMIGSATMANVFVASGKADLYQENDIFFWVIAAGAVLVKEAGGKISISEPTKEFRVNAIFSNGLLW